MAVVSAGIAILSAEKQRSTINTAADQSYNAQMAAIEEERKAKEEQIKLLEKAVEQGRMDIVDAYNRAEEIISSTDIEGFEGYRDPWAYNMAQDYLENPDQIFDLPGVEFQYEQGQRALENMLSKTTGGGLSGEGVEAAIQYGQNFAATKIDQALNRLFPFINLAVSAENVDINRAIERDTALANLAVGRGTSLADLELAGASGEASAITSSTQGITQALSNISSIYSETGTNLANIEGGLATNLSDIISGVLEDYGTYKYLQDSGLYSSFSGG